MTTDTETLCRFLGIEFPEDLGQVVPKIPPLPRPTPRPVRRPNRPVGCVPYGRTLGANFRALTPIKPTTHLSTKHGNC
jgi:hypothetical protein